MYHSVAPLTAQTPPLPPPPETSVADFYLLLYVRTQRLKSEWRMEKGTRANALAPKIFIIEFGFVVKESSLLRVRSLDRDQQSA